MAVTLVRLDISHEAIQTDRADGKIISTEVISERGLRVDLILSPDTEEDLELNQLGFVRLHIEAHPKILPDMTRAQTVEWLREKLKKML